MAVESTLREYLGRVTKREGGPVGMYGTIFYDAVSHGSDVVSVVRALPANPPSKDVEVEAHAVGDPCRIVLDTVTGKKWLYVNESIVHSDCEEEGGGEGEP